MRNTPLGAGCVQTGHSFGVAVGSEDSISGVGG
jgi:hypothetical protein